ncbi:CLUMA_CG001359, isoform A [Clunio marinus]|uniref:CLUMA_CG001359, isoform A n=1 Tax=Clunio marinus TaxID=568069 RepID=A0A1J1HJ21_9DIPT|nr:CLUMA_CG001359, isoform A [Clunio marinus]
MLSSTKKKIQANSAANVEQPSTSKSGNLQDSDNLLKGKINKQKSSSEEHESCQEIAEGNCLVAKGEKSDGRINTPKKRFFDLKRTAESASNKISSISPTRFALSLTPKLRRKSAINHKLSQLEQQSNLFIRDGFEQQINNQEGQRDVISIENSSSACTEQQESSAQGKKNKKSSLISTFSFKTSPSALNKNDDDTMKRNLNPKTNFKILCKNFSKDSKQKVLETTTTGNETFPNYEEINILNENEDEDENDNGSKRVNLITNVVADVLNDNTKSNCDETVDISSLLSSTKMESSENFQSELNKAKDGNCGEMLSKAEFNANLFKNIPVRPRKGQVPHMENYCLFDPSVDFCNEKETRKYFPSLNFSPKKFHNFHVVQEKNLCKQQLKCNEVEESNSHHNYYEIDPEMLAQDEAAAASSFDRHDNEANPLSKLTEASLSRKSSSSSSCDYPQFNSVLETTPSSTFTIESTDDNESNAYEKSSYGCVAKLNSRVFETINQTKDGSESVMKTSNVVTATGTKKKSPPFERIVKQMSRNLQISTDNNANQQQTTTMMVKGKSNKINLAFCSENVLFDPLRSSHSLPQLQNIALQREKLSDGDYNIEINNRTTIHLKRNLRNVRPMSSESLDSGFTTPSPPNETLSIQSQNASNADNKQIVNLNSIGKDLATNESCMLKECENVQQLIEVSLNRM